MTPVTMLQCRDCPSVFVCGTGLGRLQRCSPKRTDGEYRQHFSTFCTILIRLLIVATTEIAQTQMTFSMPKSDNTHNKVRRTFLVRSNKQ